MSNTITEIPWHVSSDEIESALHGFLPSPENVQNGHAILLDAMREATLGGGKRLRAHLVLEAAHAVGGETSARNAMAAACALEMIHAYSLIHDDLPAMDDADTRRGKPSSHRKYGEAAAILAGDGLLTLAFEVISQDSENAALSLRAIHVLAKAAGEAGMVGGQATDIAWSNGEYAPRGDELLQMHAMKTGALIRAACEIGALLGNGNERQIGALRDYGTYLGCAFQITDDLLDAVGDPSQTGKASSDAQNGKITATAVFGLDGARSMAQESCEAALRSLCDFGDEVNALRVLAHSVLHREK